MQIKNASEFFIPHYQAVTKKIKNSSLFIWKLTSSVLIFEETN